MVRNGSQAVYLSAQDRGFTAATISMATSTITLTIARATTFDLCPARGERSGGAPGCNFTARQCMTPHGHEAPRKR